MRLLLVAALATTASALSRSERRGLRDEAAALFTHGFDSYMEHAFPADTLKPLSCAGADDWGSMSLTLLDTMDTLALMGNATEFERAVDWCLEHCSFDTDQTVSVFETNIRALGGLLSAHVLAADASLGLLSRPYDLLDGYVDGDGFGGLLALAVDLADRLLPAFDTLSGIPFGSINLVSGVDPSETPLTCTAAAGSLLLEFGALSRLTGEPKYEEAARKAALALWQRRSSRDLLGAHVNLRTGAWTQADAGVGRGIDSFYEYMLKAHMLLGGDEYLAVFHDAYHAALKQLKHGSWYVDVHMSTGQVTWPLFNSLQGFWPGLQMMIGEFELGIDTLRAHHALWKRLGFHPEGFNLASMGIQPGQKGYPLRPEHVESLFYAHRATKQDAWLDAGKDVLRALQSLRVPCGVAALSDVSNRTMEDNMESFFLSETTKYLWLLFDDDDAVYRHGEYLFTTEAHPLPLDLLRRIERRRAHGGADGYRGGGEAAAGGGAELSEEEAEAAAQLGPDIEPAAASPAAEVEAEEAEDDDARRRRSTRAAARRRRGWRASVRSSL